MTDMPTGALRGRAAVVACIALTILTFGRADAQYELGGAPGSAGAASEHTLTSTSGDESVQTGAVTHSIPIEVPPGRLGMTPKIALVYNSMSKANGAFGLGWDVPIDSIQSNLKNGYRPPGTQDPYGGRDQFNWVRSGSSSALVPGPGSSTIYRLKIDDGAFSQIEWDAGSGGWLVYTKDGLVQSYGRRAGANSVQRGPAGTVFRWCLDEVTDTSGNTIAFTYHQDRGAISSTGSSTRGPLRRSESSSSGRPTSDRTWPRVMPRAQRSRSAIASERSERTPLCWLAARQPS